MKETLFRFMSILALIQLSTAPLYSMDDTSCPPMDETEERRMLYQPRSLATLCMLQFQEVDTELVPFDRRKVVDILRSANGSPSLAFLQGIQLYVQSDLSLTDLELLIHITKGIKADLSCYSTAEENSVLLDILNLIIAVKGDMSIVFQELMIQEMRKAISYESFVKSVKTLFKLGMSGNVCFRGTHVHFEYNEAGRTATVINKYRRALRQFILHNVGNLAPSVCLQVVEMLLNNGANPNECWDVSEPVQECDAGQKPLLVEYIRRLKKADGVFGAVNYDLLNLLLQHNYDLMTIFEGKTLIQELEEQIRECAAREDGPDWAELQKLLTFLEQYQLQKKK